jgi:hypothetical protein
MAAVTFKGEGTTGKWFAIRLTISGQQATFQYVALGHGRVREIRRHLLTVKTSRARQFAGWILDHTEE